MKVRPLYDNVLIEPLQKDEVTASGIVLPDSAKEKPQEGKIIAVGEGKIEEGKLVLIPVKVGEVVVYKKWGGNEVKVDGKELLLVRAEDLLAVVK